MHFSLFVFRCLKVYFPLKYFIYKDCVDGWIGLKCIIYVEICIQVIILPYVIHMKFMWLKSAYLMSSNNYFFQFVLLIKEFFMIPLD